MNSRVKIVILVCVGLLFSLYLWKSGKKRNAGVSSDKKAEEIDNSGPSEVGSGSGTADEQSSKDVAEKQRLDYPEIKRSHVGLQTVPYKENAKNARMLAIEVVPQPGCHRGDLEAIKALVGDEGSMLFTIEPMVGGGAGKNSLVASRKISVASIESGIAADIALADSPEGTYGIYLCSDNQGTGSCASKMAADYNDILSQNTVRSDRDATFFYQMIVLAKPDAQLFNGT
ncbi:MAG: hypothetical protein FJ146_08040, partial [Deltaproteobacteria bacterium]|nr:hypothetical protein [Deltaproteobacteria bacterium]